MNAEDLRRFMGYVRRDGCSGCWEWTGTKNPLGYGKFHLEGKSGCLAHRVSYQHYFGNVSAGSGVLHRCDNPSCVNPDHLFAGTQADNMRDCSRKGRVRTSDRSGENNQHAKLTRNRAAVIRQRYFMGGVTMKNLAEEFDVSEATISRVVNKRTWNDVSEI
jgi:hypothetical protein